MALGRNEAGQLGVGFASQEGTRGLVEGFEGEEILSVRAGVQATYVLVRDEGAHPASVSVHLRSRFLEDRTILYSSGNLARGRLGQPARYPPPDTTEDTDAPRQHTLPRATVVELPEGAGRIKQIETGFEHLLVLTGMLALLQALAEESLTSHELTENGQVFGTGCNTDGQLGLASASSDIYQLTRLPLPREIDKEGGVERISAGADTSAFITKSGKVWTFGNSVRPLSYSSLATICAHHLYRRSTARPCTARRSTKLSRLSQSIRPSSPRIAESSTTAAAAPSLSLSTVRRSPSFVLRWEEKMNHAGAIGSAQIGAGGTVKHRFEHTSDVARDESRSSRPSHIVS